jgi:two-component system sensor histidine kinase TctE
VAVLLQPVASGGERAMAMVQVAETLELRHTLARQMLLDTLQRQALLIGVITAVVLFVVQRVTGPVRQLSRSLDLRREDDLTPIDAPELPRELQPLTEAANRVMSRLQHLLDHQQRFVRDAAHQLRTPLAVLKVQVQSAQRGDLAPADALQGIALTVDRATQLTNQMLTFAKVEQLRQQQSFEVMDWAESVRDLVLEMSPLIAEKNLDFALDATPCRVRAHEWMLREMVRNLLHNAIRHSPAGAVLQLRLSETDGQVTLLIRDAGGGLPEDLRARLFQPFSTVGSHAGTGLGLTIAREIARALGGSVQLQNRVQDGQVCGLDASIGLPGAA